MSVGRKQTGFRLNAVGALCLVTLAWAAPAGDSPVADAAMRGDIEAVRSLLRQGEDVNAAQGDGMTALHWAAGRGEVEMARVLVYAGANVRASTRNGAYTPLLLASSRGHAPVIATLLAAGSRASERTATGATALHLAAASGSVEAVNALVEAGADPNATENAAGQTPLMFAAAADRAAVIRALMAHGADASARTRVIDVPERSDADDTARRLRNARLAAVRAEEEHASRPVVPPDPTAELQGRDITRALQPERAVPDPTAELQGRDTARAAESPRPAAAAGGTADRTAPDPAAAPRGQGAGGAQQRAAARPAEPARTAPANAAAGRAGGAPEGGARPPAEPAPQPLSYAQLVGGHGGLTALLHAARQGHVESALALLDAGADVDQVSAGDRTSPLLIATINGHFTLAKQLLERGADPDLASDAGATPLYGAINVHWAPHAFYPQPSTVQQEVTHLELLKALLEAGADPNTRLTRKVWYTGYNFDQSGVDETGATAFWRAAQSSDVEAMRLLVAHGADPHVWSKVLPERRAPTGRNADEDLDAPPPVPVGGPAVSPLHAATGAGYDGNYHRNAPYGWLPAVKYLVDELGFDVNEPDYKGYTPLHNAAFRGDNEMIRYLVEKGADVMAVARSGQTTVDMANGPIQRLQPFPETIRLLEGMGAKNSHKCVSC